MCTGRPWGDRGALNGPRTWRKRPWWSIRWTLSSIAWTPDFRSAITASSSQLSQSLSTTSTNSCARAYRSSLSGTSESPKLCAASVLNVVTMFQPARPPEIWSSEANRRARLYGS